MLVSCTHVARVADREVLAMDAHAHVAVALAAKSARATLAGPLAGPVRLPCLHLGLDLCDLLIVSALGLYGLLARSILAPSMRDVLETKDWPPMLSAMIAKLMFARRAMHHGATAILGHAGIALRASCSSPQDNIPRL